MAGRRRSARRLRHLRTAPQRYRRRALAALLALVVAGVAGHGLMVYRMVRADRPAPALRVAAVVLHGPMDSGGVSFAPYGTLRFALPDGSSRQVTTDVPTRTRAGDTLPLWVTPTGEETAAPERVSAWGEAAHACFWGLLAGFAALLAAAVLSVPLVRRGERRRFLRIVEPLRSDAAAWLRDLR